MADRWMLMVTAKLWSKRTIRYATHRSFPELLPLNSHFQITQIMSTKAKLTLAATSLGALGIIIFVHHGQKVEKAVCLARSVSEIILTSELGNARRCHP